MYSFTNVYLHDLLPRQTHKPSISTLYSFIYHVYPTLLLVEPPNAVTRFKQRQHSIRADAATLLDPTIHCLTHHD